MKKARKKSRDDEEMAVIGHWRGYAEDDPTTASRLGFSETAPEDATMWESFL